MLRFTSAKALELCHHVLTLACMQYDSIVDSAVHGKRGVASGCEMWLVGLHSHTFRPEQSSNASEDLYTPASDVSINQ